MLIKYFNYITLPSRILIFCFFLGCSANQKHREEIPSVIKKSSRTRNIYCTKADQRMKKSRSYNNGELPCLKYRLPVSSSEALKVEYVTLDQDAKDIYDRGYQILKRIKNNNIIEVIKLRKDKDAYWSDTPFVRIRKQKYLADLDGDGSLEFAIYPFSSGSAIIGTVRIYSLKEKITLWGHGRYQFEGDSYVQLDCMKWSKFKPDEIKNCK